MTASPSGRPIGHVLVFFVLVFALTVPFLALQALTGVELLPNIPLGALAIVTPVAAAAALTFRTGGARAVVHLLGLSVDAGRVKSPAWYLLAILLPVLVAVLSFGALRWMGIAVPNPPVPALTNVVLFAVFLLAAWGEELGWMGYAYDPLEDRFGPLRASLLLGAVWALWHFIPLLQIGRSVTFIAWWTLGTVSMRVVLVWLYKGGRRSVFAVALFHATSNLSWQLFPVQGSYFDPKVHGLIMAGIAAVIAIGWGMGLGRDRLVPVTGPDT